MRKKIVAGNWKMNLTRDEAQALTKSLAQRLKEKATLNQRVLICPPSIHLSDAIASAGPDGPLEVGAQNMHQADSGAYTGELSGAMLLSHGIRTVLVGHSERRAYFHEDNHLLKQKVDAALGQGIEVVYCFGELLEERQGATHFEVVATQLKQALFHLTADQWSSIVLAYEPVWAIGTGVTASPEQAQEMHAFIRQTVAAHYGDACAQNVSILYGGSVKPNNAAEIFGKPDVDGGLIGGAALKADDFMAIVNAAG
ncbi:MAG: triose-phosphate isomerase [Flavobacteriaceae bacterium]|nr:triose-phosphate isomerase [Flavobacteriaceae bacterium]MDG1962291.1 triose-phosphate isomerase [Flavobacteriaceae bacterium]